MLGDACENFGTALRAKCALLNRLGLGAGLNRPFVSNSSSNFTPYCAANCSATLAESLMFTPTKRSWSRYRAAALASTGNSRRHGSHVEYHMLRIVGVPSRLFVEVVSPSTFSSSIFGSCSPVSRLLVAMPSFERSTEFDNSYLGVSVPLSVRAAKNPKKVIAKMISACLISRVLAGTKADYRLLLPPTRTRTSSAVKPPSARGEALR